MADATEEGQKVLYLSISAGLVLMAGLMSGLTLGLMSLDQVDLEVGIPSRGINDLSIVRARCPPAAQVLVRSGTAKEKTYAARISPVYHLHNLCVI